MDEIAHFFKVILQDDTIRDRKLVIPSKFVKDHGNSLPDEVELMVPNGAKWKVELVKDGGNIWFQNGWPQFVDFYSVSPGFVVNFGYHKIKGCFDVAIFDKSTSEIDYPSCPQPEFEAVKGKGHNPSFSITMQPTYVVNRCRLNLPVDFARSYLKNQSGNVKLISPNGITYPAKYGNFKKFGKDAKRPYSQANIANGWKKFAKDNHLAVGDVCVFELIDEHKITFKVAISRGSKEGRDQGTLISITLVHGGVLVVRGGIKIYTGGFVEEKRWYEEDKISRLELLFAVNGLGYELCGPLYYKGKEDGKFVEIKADINLRNYLFSLGDNEDAFVYVDSPCHDPRLWKRVSGDELEAHKARATINTVAHMCVKRVPQKEAVLVEEKGGQSSSKAKRGECSKKAKMLREITICSAF